MPEERLRASIEGLGGEFGAGAREVSQQGGLAPCVMAGGQGRPGLGDAFAAAGAHPQLAGQVTQAGGAVLYRGADVALRNRFADADDHGGIVNANANDCQYRSI